MLSDPWNPAYPPHGSHLKPAASVHRSEPQQPVGLIVEDQADTPPRRCCEEDLTRNRLEDGAMADKFVSQNEHGGSQPCVTLVPRDTVASSGSQ